MDEEIERLVVSVRADTNAFERDVQEMCGTKLRTWSGDGMGALGTTERLQRPHSW